MLIFFLLKSTDTLLSGLGVYPHPVENFPKRKIEQPKRKYKVHTSKYRLDIERSQKGQRGIKRASFQNSFKTEAGWSPIPFAL